MQPPQPLENALAGLAVTLERLYAAFASYQVGPSIDAAPGITTEQCEQLLRTELRKLNCEQLSYYGFKAMTTWGNAHEYKHFLPRILDLAVLGDGRNWPGLGMLSIASKVELAGGPDALAAQRPALADFFAAAWAAAQLSDPETSELRITTCLQGAGVLCGDVAPLLEADYDESLASTLQLANMLSDVWLDLESQGRLTSEWGDGNCRTAIIEWLAQPAREAALEHAFADVASGPEAERLAVALDEWSAFTSHLKRCG